MSNTENFTEISRRFHEGFTKVSRRFYWENFGGKNLEYRFVFFIKLNDGNERVGSRPATNTVTKMSHSPPTLW